MRDILRKYGEAATFDFSLFEIDGVDLRVDAVHASGDSTIMKNEGAPANTANGFVDEGDTYSISLTATEMECARGVIKLVDQTATKAWLDITIEFETYGHASAQHAFDLDSADVTTDSASRTASQATGFATATNLQTVDDNVDLVLLDTDELQTNQGNWLTATGFSTHSAADIWSVATRSLTTFGTLVADIATAVWGAVTRTLTAGTKDTEIDAIKTITDALPDSGALTSIAQDSTVAKDSTVGKEATLTDIKGTTFATGTDSLEAIRDRGDVAWITGAGGSAPTVGEIRTEMETNGGKLDHIWETTEDDLGVRRFTANGLEQAPVANVAGLATEAKQDIIDTNIDQIETAVITNAAGVDIAADIIALKAVADAIPTTPMRGTENANTVIPDIAGTAATLHGITDGKIDAMKIVVDAMDLVTKEILDFEGGDWDFVSNQHIYTKIAGGELARFNLTKAGVPDSDAPDKRERV